MGDERCSCLTIESLRVDVWNNNEDRNALIASPDEEEQYCS